MSSIFPLISLYCVFLIFDSTNVENQIEGITSLVVLVISLVLTIRFGFKAFIITLLSVALILALMFPAVITISIFEVFGLVEKEILTTTNEISAVGASLLAASLTGLSMTLGLGIFVVALTSIATVVGTVGFCIATTITATILGFFAYSITTVENYSGTGAILAILAIGLTLLILSVEVYLCWRILGNDKRDTWVRKFNVYFTALGGTNFCGANLTNANFSFAKLKSTDFNTANLNHVRWYAAKILELVRPGNTYLKDSQIRKWLVGEGQNKNFNNKDLQGINLQGANLINASFVDANLTHTDLSGATLDGSLYFKLEYQQQDKTK